MPLGYAPKRYVSLANGPERVDAMRSTLFGQAQYGSDPRVCSGDAQQAKVKADGVRISPPSFYWGVTISAAARVKASRPPSASNSASTRSWIIWRVSELIG